MPPCHATPFVRPGVLIAAGATQEEPPCDGSSTEWCDYCGSNQLEWRKCKLVCTACRQINKSCADL